MAIQQVCLDYGRESRLLLFAESLAQRLQATLEVRSAAPDPREVGASSEPLIDECLAVETDQLVVLEILERMPRAADDLFVLTQQQGPLDWPATNAVVVSNILQNHPTLPVLRPAYQTTLPATAAPVFIPFGNKPDLEHGYRWGISLAKQLGVPAIAWHTSWKRADVRSSNPRDHWCPEAQEVAAQAQQYARSVGVVLEVIVETARNVVLAMHRAAMQAHALCIVVQQDQNIVDGGYDKQLVDVGHVVPVVILPKRRPV